MSGEAPSVFANRRVLLPPAPITRDELRRRLRRDLDAELERAWPALEQCLAKGIDVGLALRATAGPNARDPYGALYSFREFSPFLARHPEDSGVQRAAFDRLAAGDPQGARDLLEAHVRTAPRDGRALALLAALLNEAEPLPLEERLFALEYARRAAESRPGDLAIQELIARLAYASGELEVAHAAIRTAFPPADRSAKASWGRATALVRRDDVDSAIAELEAAARAPADDSADAIFAAHAARTIGHRTEWIRRQRALHASLPAAPFLWGPADLRGRRVVLICGYYGFGDVIEWARFLPALRRRGAAQLIYAHGGQEAELLRDAGLVDELASPQFAAGDADLLLPLVAGCLVDDGPTEPLRGGYLPRPARASRSRMRIALVHRSGGGGDRSMPQRALPLEEVRRLVASLPEADWFAPVFDAYAARELAPLPQWDYSRQSDLRGSAEALASADLVVTTDNVYLHLAGAMGVPTLALLSRACDYRFGLRGERCPLYDSVRLLRQERLSEWSAPVTRAAELARIIGQGGSLWT